MTGAPCIPHGSDEDTGSLLCVMMFRGSEFGVLPCRGDGCGASWNDGGRRKRIAETRSRILDKDGATIATERSTFAFAITRLLDTASLLLLSVA